MMNNLGGMLQMLSSSQNPDVILQQLAQTNPTFSKILPMVRGKSPQELETYVRNMFQSQGMDINGIANQFGLKI